MNRILKNSLVLLAGVIFQTQCWAIEEQVLYGVNPQEGGGNKTIQVQETQISVHGPDTNSILKRTQASHY